jgi:hypothetical protein
MELSQPSIIIGAACLLAAFIAYLRDTSKAVFPIVLALVGVFLCGAQVVKAALPGGGSIELSKVADATKKASKTVDASSDAIAKQNAVLQQLGTRLDTLQSAVQSLQTELNARLAQTNTPPVALPQAPALAASRASLDAALKESFVAHQHLATQTAELRTAVKSLPTGP